MEGGGIEKIVVEILKNDFSRIVTVDHVTQARDVPCPFSPPPAARHCEARSKVAVQRCGATVTKTSCVTSPSFALTGRVFWIASLPLAKTMSQKRGQASTLASSSEVKKEEKFIF
ncbi:MAG: hypothetical protein K0A99_02995 [Desulfoarculaceae bacterium]|nr:hypothetical protein [Desulfoarculaceae bacterium]